ncbi:MAG: hypothetical protein ACXIUV_05275, partial [Alkalilacustris sp.]
MLRDCRRGQIAASVGVGRSTVAEDLRRAEVARLGWPLPDGLCDEGLERRLFPPVPAPTERLFAEPDWPALYRELWRPGATLSLLWEEYRGTHSDDGYGYSALCEHYHRWAGRLPAVMRQRHVAGERVFVDCSGKRMTVIDPATGAARPVELFIAVRGASNMTYAEAGQPRVDRAASLGPDHRTLRGRQVLARRPPLSSDHVWTAPAGQGRCLAPACGRSRPCMRRLICGTSAARPDEVRRRSG